MPIDRKKLVELAEWLLGPGAQKEKIEWFVEHWLKNPGAAERWAAERARR
jgi:hypothetical protein